MLFAQKLNVCLLSATICVLMKQPYVNANGNLDVQIHEFIQQNFSTEETIDGGTALSRQWDTIFHMYYNRSSQATAYLRELNTRTQLPGLSASEILNFVCSKDGDELMAVSIVVQRLEYMADSKENKIIYMTAPLDAYLPRRDAAKNSGNFAEFLGFAIGLRCNEVIPANGIKQMLKNVEIHMKRRPGMGRMLRLNPTEKFSNIFHSKEKSTFEILVSLIIPIIVAQLLSC